MRKQHFRPLSRGELEKGKERGRKKTREKLKYQQKLRLMRPQTETTNKTTEKCFTLGQLPDDVKLSDSVRDALNSIAALASRNFDMRVYVCIRDNVVMLNVQHDFVRYLDICVDACMDAMDAIGCVRDGRSQKCYDTCYKRMREEAFKTLYDNYLLIRHELRLRGINYTFDVPNVRLPSNFIIEITQ